VPKKYVFLSIVEKFLAKQNYKKRRSQTYALASLKSFNRTTVMQNYKIDSLFRNIPNNYQLMY
ncbi:MAG: hypothetical protein KBB11_07890, partial [Bacteroidales bacterium]|nr:hypothetical protein [Bacteroidales bacterium]